MATSTARKPNPEPYLPPGELASDGNFASRPADVNPRYNPPRSSQSSASTGMIILGVLVVIALIIAVSYGTSGRVTAPAGTDTTSTQPVLPDNPPAVPDATGQTQTTPTVTIAPAPAIVQPPAAAQPAKPELITPPVQTQPVLPGTGTTVQ